MWTETTDSVSRSRAVTAIGRNPGQARQRISEAGQASARERYEAEPAADRRQRPSDGECLIALMGRNPQDPAVREGQHEPAVLPDLRRGDRNPEEPQQRSERDRVRRLELHQALRHAAGEGRLDPDLDPGLDHDSERVIHPELGDKPGPDGQHPLSPALGQSRGTGILSHAPIMPEPELCRPPGFPG
jgi:hypothetical protein